MSKVSSVDEDLRKLRDHWHRSPHLRGAKLIVQLCDLALAQQEAIRSGQQAMEAMRVSTEAAREVIEKQTALVHAQTKTLMNIAVFVGYDGDVINSAEFTKAISQWSLNDRPLDARSR